MAILCLTPFSAYSNRDMLPSGGEFVAAPSASLAWTAAAMLIGWSMGTLLRLDRDERFTFLIEFSARNIAMTVIVALGSLGRLDLGLFAAAYSMTGFPAVILLSILRGRRTPQQTQPIDPLSEFESA